MNAVWIDGDEHEISPDPIVTADGDWMLREGDNNWTLSIKDGKGELKSGETSIKLSKLNLSQDRITFSVQSDTILQKGVTRFNGSISNEIASGLVVYADGNKGSWSATFDSASKKKGINEKRKHRANLISYILKVPTD